MHSPVAADLHFYCSSLQLVTSLLNVSRTSLFRSGVRRSRLVVRYCTASLSLLNQRSSTSPAWHIASGSTVGTARWCMARHARRLVVDTTAQHRSTLPTRLQTHHIYFLFFVWICDGCDAVETALALRCVTMLLLPATFGHVAVCPASKTCTVRTALV